MPKRTKKESKAKAKNSSNSSKGKSGNTKQISCSKHWCFTLNNYTKEDLIIFRDFDSSIVPIYIFQEETGVAGEIENNEGTPHLQGYIRFDVKRRPKNLFGDKLGHMRTHWGITRDIKASIIYCGKNYTRTGETFRRGIKPPYAITLAAGLYDWEIKIMEFLKKEPNDRDIHWFWENRGCAGKTTFQKYICLNNKKAITLGGTASNMKNGVIEYMKTHFEPPEIILINIPRGRKHISYSGIEELKDMFFYSGKYEGGMVNGRNPHLIIFANREPDFNEISLDKWKICKIRNGHRRIISAEVQFNKHNIHNEMKRCVPRYKIYYTCKKIFNFAKKIWTTGNVSLQ